VAECVLKSCDYTCAVLSPSGETTFAVGSDKSLKEICDNHIVTDVPSRNKGSALDVVPTQVAISASGRMLFSGTSHGVVRSLRMPLTTAGEWTSTITHHGAVTKMRISADDQFLFTVGEDGCVVQHKVRVSCPSGTHRRCLHTSLGRKPVRTLVRVGFLAILPFLPFVRVRSPTSPDLVPCLTCINPTVDN